MQIRPTWPSFKLPTLQAGGQLINELSRPHYGPIKSGLHGRGTPRAIINSAKVARAIVWTRRAPLSRLCLLTGSSWPTNFRQQQSRWRATDPLGRRWFAASMVPPAPASIDTCLVRERVQARERELGQVNAEVKQCFVFALARNSR